MGSGGRGEDWGKKEVGKRPGLRKVKVRADWKKGGILKRARGRIHTRGSSNSERGWGHKMISHQSESFPLSTVRHVCSLGYSSRFMELCKILLGIRIT